MQYTIRPNPIMTRCLSQRHRDAGIEVAMAGDRTSLVRKDEVLKTWGPGLHPTMIEAHEAADRILEAEENLFTFERSPQQEILDTMKEEYRKAGGVR